MSSLSFFNVSAFGNRLLSDHFTRMDMLSGPLAGNNLLSSTATYNLLQKEKNLYELAISVPGYSKSDIDVLVQRNRLIINGKKETEKVKSADGTDHKKWLHRGINRGVFNLDFTLENPIDIRRASLNNGLLVLLFSYEIPAQEKPQKIDIQDGKKSSHVINQDDN